MPEANTPEKVAQVSDATPVPKRKKAKVPPPPDKPIAPTPGQAAFYAVIHI